MEMDLEMQPQAATKNSPQIRIARLACLRASDQLQRAYVFAAVWNILYVIVIPARISAYACMIAIDYQNPC